MENFRILAVIGEGTYGKVFKAQHKTTGRVVAIKKFKQTEEEDPHVRKTMNREIRVLKDFKNDNIVTLTQVFREDGKLFLVFDYVQETLLELLQKTPKGLPPESIKRVIYQILTAVEFLHSSRVIHRDIKPENLLISESGVVKLCDFGFARKLQEKANYQYTDYVSTRWYRAPELLVGDAAYSTSVDVWAIGCIFAEIFNGLPLFPGQSDLHTLQLILETITADDIENDRATQELTKKQRTAFRLNPLFEGQSVPTAAEAIIAPEHIKEVSFGALLKDIDEVALDFIRSCLVIDGQKRLSCADLMKHEFFDADFKARFIGVGDDLPDGFETEFAKMIIEDENKQAESSLKKQFTKDGKDQMSEADLKSEIKDDDEEEEEDMTDSDQFSEPEERHRLQEELEQEASMAIQQEKLKSINQHEEATSNKGSNSALPASAPRNDHAAPEETAILKAEDQAEEKVLVLVVPEEAPKEKAVTDEEGGMVVGDSETVEAVAKEQDGAPAVQQDQPTLQEDANEKRRSLSQAKMASMEGTIAEDVREDNVSSAQSVQKRMQMLTPEKVMTPRREGSNQKTDLSYESPMKKKVVPHASDDYSDHQLVAIQKSGQRDKVKSVMERPIENYIEQVNKEDKTLFKSATSSAKHKSEKSHSTLSRQQNNANSKSSGLGEQLPTISITQDKVKDGQFSSNASAVTPKIPQITSSKSPGNLGFSTSFNTRKGPPNQNILQSTTLVQNGQMIMSTQPKDFIDTTGQQQKAGHYFSRATPNKNNSLLPAKIQKSNVTYSNHEQASVVVEDETQPPLKVIGSSTSMVQSRGQTKRELTPDRHMPAIQQISSNSQQVNSIQVQKLRNQKKYLITPNVRGAPTQSTMHSQQHSLSDAKQHYESVAKDNEVDGSYSTPAKGVPATMKGKGQPQSLTQTTSLESLQRKVVQVNGQFSPRKLPVLKGQQLQQQSSQQFNKLKKSSIETSSNVINEQAPQQGIFFVNKIQTKNQNSFQNLQQPVGLKRNVSQHGAKYMGQQQPPLKINDITPEKPQKQNQRGNYVVQGQPTSTNNVKTTGGPQVYYKVMHSTYQNYHRSSNSHLLANDLGISAKKLSPNQIMGPGSKKNVVLNDEIARQSSSQVNLLETHTSQGQDRKNKNREEAQTQGFASLSRTNNQGTTMQQLVTFPKLMDAASHFKMQPGSKTQPKMSVPETQAQLRNNSQMETQSQLLYGVTSSTITNINGQGTGSSMASQSRPVNQQSQNYLMNQTRSSSHVVHTTLTENQTNFVSPQKFSTKKMPMQKAQYSMGGRQASLNPSLQSTIRDEQNQYREGNNSQLRNVQKQQSQPKNAAQQEYANNNKVLKNVTVHTAEGANSNAKNVHCFFVGSGAQAHLPNRSYNGSVLQQQSAVRLGGQLSGSQLPQNSQVSPDPSNRVVQNLMKPTGSQQLSSSPIGTSINVGTGANTHPSQLTYSVEHDSAGAFPRRNLVTNKLKNQQVLQQRRRERADMHTSIFAVPATSTTSNAPPGANIQLASHSSKADYTGNIQPMFGGLQQSAKQGGSNLQLPSLKKLQPAATESTMAHSSLSPSKSGGASTQIISSTKLKSQQQSQPQVGGDRQYSFANKYGNEMSVKMSSKNIQHQQLMIRQQQTNVGSVNIQHTRIPSSTLSKHTGQSRTSQMAMVVGSATNVAAAQGANGANPPNFAQQVPKQYRMYLGTSAINQQNNSRASGDQQQQSGVSPRPTNLPKQNNGGLIIENSLGSVQGLKPPSQMNGSLQQPQLSQTNSSTHLRST